MIFYKVSPKTMGGRACVDVVHIYRNRGVYAGAGSKLVFKIKEQIFSDCKAGGKTDRILVYNGLFIGSCTGGAEVSICVRRKLFWHKNSLKQLKHALVSYGYGLYRRRCLTGAVCGFYKIKQKEIYVLIPVTGDYGKKVLRDIII